MTTDAVEDVAANLDSRLPVTVGALSVSALVATLNLSRKTATDNLACGLSNMKSASLVQVITGFLGSGALTNPWTCPALSASPALIRKAVFHV